jgi:aldose 1-epimerase
MTIVLAIAIAWGCGPKPAKPPADPKKPAAPSDTPKPDTPKPDTPKPDAPKPDTPPDKEDAKMKLKQEPFGKLADGTQIDLFTLRNAGGLKVKLINYGAIITAIETPDRNGKLANITLFRDSLADYLAGHPYFGCVAGRYANRIAFGKFKIGDDEFRLAANNNGHHLHGGKVGFDKHAWKAEPVEGEGFAGVRLTLVSPDGDEGYPGALTATVTYTLTDANELKMDYRATTDKPTVLNLTNHAYWNLAGAGTGDVLGHELMINADRFLPVDDGLIPLGVLKPVADTPMDFAKPTAIGARIAQVEGGYDHCYVLRRKPDEALALCARVVEPKSGRTLEIVTTQPAVQFYSGNFLDGTVTGGGAAYEKHWGFCLETQHYPDSPNRPDFPTTLLKPGETYEHSTVHRFGVQ